MSNDHKTIGIVKWYSAEKGYGVLGSITDGEEYFVHRSKISFGSNYTLSEGDLVVFKSEIDHIRDRKIAVNVRSFERVKHLKWIVFLWTKESEVSDDILAKAINSFIKIGKEKDIKDGGDGLTTISISVAGVLLKYLQTEDVFVRLFSIFKNSIYRVYDQHLSPLFWEQVEINLVNNINSEANISIVAKASSIYTNYYIALKQPSYNQECISNVIRNNNPSRILDELIRFVKDVN
ncbi:MAG: cold shock domain-containing protein, partial [Muribaculaceae bacterium]|nr:cold shock domain-containing protein [Muribaculaceae bacterium]